MSIINCGHPAKALLCSKKMNKNITFPDRSIRLIIAVALTFMAGTKMITGVWAVVALVVAVVFAVTAALNFCPIYRILGIRRWEKRDSIKS